ncbi:MAG: glycosyltransferase family 39 protein [Chloroflexi bacterium]|nr:glycosyltransferase family 39 protein [Chloroflexota bacterium]
MVLLERNRNTPSPREMSPAPLPPQTSLRRGNPPLRFVQWMCLLLACAGASWFAIQFFLTPQPTQFPAPWENAQWITPADGNSPVGYFRYTTSLESIPDSAFITVAATQIFRLYVNGTFISATAIPDIVNGKGIQAHIYDVTSALVQGPNLIAIRVSNLDGQPPSLIASFGVVHGSSTVYHVTGTAGWLATSQSSLVNPRYDPRAVAAAAAATPAANAAGASTTPGASAPAATAPGASAPAAANASTASVTGSTVSQSMSQFPSTSTPASSVVNPSTVVASGLPPWITGFYDSSSWQRAKTLAVPPASPPLTENPVLYQYPLNSQWMSGGAGHDAYFVRTIARPIGTTSVWLRIGATGPATVFINGNQVIAWNGDAPAPSPTVSDFLSSQEQVIQYQTGLVVGLYDVSPYFHMGNNTIAVHVVSPGNTNSQTGLSIFNAALALDLFTGDIQNHYFWFPSGGDGWQASDHTVTGWEQGGNVTQSWFAPFAVGRPGLTRSVYISEVDTSRNVNIIPLVPLGLAILVVVGMVLGLWSLMAGLAMSRFSFSRSEAGELMSLSYLPALATELLLIVLSREPQIPQPFPYTAFWGIALLLLVGIGYMLLWLNARRVKDLLQYSSQFSVYWETLSSADGEASIYAACKSMMERVYAWLRLNWGLVLLVFIAIPMITYQLTYEPFWADELTSYYAAKGILRTGLPELLSGFLYAKGELYSYVLAITIAIFGDHPWVLRMPAAVELLVSLPIFYFAGCYFFDRRIALFATAMLSLSPYALTWGRQIRMYEQAQFLVIIFMYLLYRAVRESNRPRLIYLAVGTLVLTYLSHEEVFIMFPAIVCGVLLVSFMESKDEREKQKGIKRFLPPMLLQKHWWIAAIVGGSIIGAQLLISRVSHPPILGTDNSQQPMIQVSTNNVLYYFKLLFLPAALSPTTPWIVLNAGLSLLGFIWGIRRRDAREIYIGLLFWGSLTILAVLFTLTADRYIYPILPLMYLGGSAAFIKGLRIMWRYVSTPLAPEHRNLPNAPRSKTLSSLSMQVMMTFASTLLCASILILPMMPFNGYNLFISRVVGFAFHRHFSDYDAVGQYMQQHMRPGDIVICVSQAITVRYYVHQTDYFFSIDRALYLFEENGRITDTPTGSTPILSQSDFQAILADHQRVWIISDNGGYQANVTGPGKRFSFPPDFHVVFEGYGSAIYARGV